jgi:crotonobetainyl-CoA:carnitine CoA-transferase CaiB-like acyl-CoA transferase
MLDEVLSEQTTAEWLVRFGGRIPASPILDVAQALANPFVAERGLVREAEDADGHVLQLLANPIRTGGLPARDKAGPGLGADTTAILEKLGYSPEMIAGLLRERIVA